MRYRQELDDLLDDCKQPNPPVSTCQTHDHELQESTKLAEEGDDRHNHRFATVTSQVIPLSGGGHKHVFFVNTDFFENHHHEVAGETGPSILIPGSKGKHIHYAAGKTTMDDGHFHEFQFTTQIDDPLHPLHTIHS